MPLFFQLFPHFGISKLGLLFSWGNVGCKWDIKEKVNGGPLTTRLFAGWLQSAGHCAPAWKGFIHPITEVMGRSVEAGHSLRL